MNLNRINSEINRQERNKLNENWQLIEQGIDEAKEVANALLDAEIDTAALQTDIQNKLNQLEQNYTPELSSLSLRLEETLKELVKLRTFTGEKFPVYISHNGLNYIAPINCLPAYELAAEAGYKYFEVDLRTTSDNVWMCFHDDDVAAMTDGTGTFASKTYSQAKALTIDTFPTTYFNTKIPTLEEFLDFCDKWAGVPVIEIKVYNSDTNLMDLIDILTDRGYLNNCIIMAFGVSTLLKVRSISPTVTLCQLSNTATQSDINNALSINSDYLSINKGVITKEFCRLAHGQGMRVGAWTIDSETEANQLIKMGVDVITTNSLLPRGM